MQEREPYKEYPICRTCLNVIRTKSYRLQENSGCGDGLKISHVLRYIVPELYLGLSSSPEICGNCRESLRVAYTFRKLCLETETMIGNYLKNVRCTAQIIDLGAVINYLSNKKTQQTAQTIISEWEDDPEETPVVEPANKKIPISNLETLKYAVASVKQLSEKSSSSTNLLPYVRVIDTPEPQKPEVEKSNTNMQKSENDELSNISYKVNNANLKGHGEMNVQSEKNNEIENTNALSQQPTMNSALIFCEETGLLRNDSGDYFSFDGTPINKEQVEVEKSTAKIRGESLFQITNICTITDDDDDCSKDSNKITDNSQENFKKLDDSKSNIDISNTEKTTNSSVNKLRTIRKESHLQVRDIAELMNPKSDNVGPQATSSHSKSEGSSKTTYIPILPKPSDNQMKTYKKSLVLQKTKLIPGSVNIVPTSSQNITKSSIFKVVQSEEAPEKPKTNILNFLMDQNLRIPESNRSVVQMNMDSMEGVLKKVMNKPVGTQQKQKDTLPKMDLPSTPTFDSLLNTSEPTNDPLKNIRIKDEPKDYDCDNLNYKSANNENEDTLSANEDNMEYGSVENTINNLDDYVDVPEFVHINNVTVKDLEDLRDQTANFSTENVWLNNITSKMDEKINSAAAIEPNKVTWNNHLPERFPYNGKMLVKCGNYYKIDESNETLKPGTKRRKYKLVPVDRQQVDDLPQEEKTENDRPDKQFCVLFTNYTEDGLYINDHDYLQGPYKKNEVLIYEGKETFCICFICGSKHWVDHHVRHMKSHSAQCPECKINLGTSYMLNLHMKSHAQPCNMCDIVIPYANIKLHARSHTNGEAEEEDEDKDMIEGELSIEDFRNAKKCFVPTCSNTSLNSSKIFIFVPKKCTKIWAKSVGQNRPWRKNYCCEDHFDMENDCKNWSKYRIGETRLRMKNVIPHRYVFEPNPLPKDYSQYNEKSRLLRHQNSEKIEEQSNKELDKLESFSDSSSLNDESVKRLHNLPLRTSNSSRTSNFNKETDTNSEFNKKTKIIDLTGPSANRKTEISTIGTDDNEDQSSKIMKEHDHNSSRDTDYDDDESERLVTRGKKRKRRDTEEQEDEKVPKRILRSRVKKECEIAR